MKIKGKKLTALMLLLAVFIFVSCKDIATDFNHFEQQNSSTTSTPNDPNDPTAIDYAHAAVTDNFVQDAQQKVDFIWVIDNSASMAGEQAALASNFGTFINDFIMQTIDFKMAVTTTHSGNSFSEYDGKDGQNSCDNSYLTSAYANSDKNDFKERFAYCVDVGTKGSGKEKGLNGAERFLERYGATFLRPDAYLIIMILSDEEDKSSKPVQTYINNYALFKGGNTGLVKLYSIVNLNQEDLKSSYESIGLRYIQAASLSDGVFASIRSQFSQTLSSFSNEILTLLSSFALSKKRSSDPEHSAIAVYVDGALSSEYVYDYTANTIQFNTGFFPPTDSLIDVSYKYKYIVQ
jgi:hypothetical protein